MTALLKIEGIGPAYAEKLQKAGVKSVEALLAHGATPAGRKSLEEVTGIKHSQILEWVNHADLFRVIGVGEEYSDLLEEAGVDTVVELSKRNPANLHAALVEANNEKKLVRRLPTPSQVVAWVECAKGLPRVIEY